MKSQAAAMIMCLLILSPTIYNSAAAPDTLAAALIQEFDLAGERAPETRYYHMETKVVQFSLDGKRVGIDIYRLRLKCVPAALSGKEGDETACQKFTVQKRDALPVAIPALEGWSYLLTTGLDEKGRVFGIDHSRFENLVDSKGAPLLPDTAYAVYNAFIDFHSLCNVFAQRTHQGPGIQDLKTIGQKIVHESAFSEPPVDLGGNVAKGSYFKNGEVTLELKGLSLVDNLPCAMVAFDSGESSFKMMMRPMPEMEIQVVGGSHYFGDIYVDLASKWVQKATMTELVVTEFTLPMPPNKTPNKINSVIERSLTIQALSQEAFMRD
jgi:hypothetical protein